MPQFFILMCIEEEMALFIEEKLSNLRKVSLLRLASITHAP